MYANIQGIKSKIKIQYLSELLNSEKFIFANFTESHLNSDILDAEVQIENYSIIRADRKNRSCGGCCIYIREDISFYEDLSWSNSVVDLCSVKLRSNDTLIINIYRPPDTENHQNAFEEALVKLEEILAQNETNNIIITGDFNFPTINWAIDDDMNVYIQSKTLPKQAKALLDLFNDHCLIQTISEPTRNHNILDLIFTNNHQLINQIQISDTIHSDHKIIQCDSARLTKVEIQTENHYEKFDTLNFHSQKIDWDKMTQEIESINWDIVLENHSVTDMYEKITEEIFEISKKWVPQRRTKRKNKFNRERRNIWSKMKKAKNYIQSSYRVIHYKNVIKSLEEELIQTYIEENEEKENHAISMIKENPKYFYKYSHKHLKTKTTIGPLRNQDNKLTDDDQEMCNLLKDQYSSVFSEPKFQFDTSKFYNNQDNPFKVDITEEDMITSINEIPNNTSSGPDTWPVQLLKSCKSQLAKPLTIMWKKSLATGEIPLNLLKANVTPIYKKGDKCTPSNYRPISLTSLIIKCMERVLRKHMINFLELGNKLNKIQHGFRRGRSCLSQLLNHFDKVISAMEQGHQYDVIYTDYSKAFDVCDFGIICEKLNNIGINDDVGRWIHNFLTQRTFTVIVNKSKSDETKVRSSVPQGTVLAPLLFIILINDIDSDIRECDIFTFADDTKIAKVITGAVDKTCLQEGILKLCDWTTENNMKFNKDKFHMIRYSCKDSIENSLYHTDENTEINEESEIKDLGVLMNKNMTFNSQIIKAVSKAKQKAGWILRTFKSRSEITIMTLYKSLVLPHLEYCSVLVSPYKITEIAMLESVQRSMTAKIAEYKHLNLNYHERLRALRLYSLQRRRERYTIIYVWKILEEKCPNLPQNPITSYEHPRKGRLCNIPPLNTKSTQRIRTIKENTLAIRGPKLFNSLPKVLRETSDTSVDSFKRALDKHLNSIPDEPPTEGYYTRENSLIYRKSAGPSSA